MDFSNIGVASGNTGAPVYECNWSPQQPIKSTSQPSPPSHHTVFLQLPPQTLQNAPEIPKAVVCALREVLAKHCAHPAQHGAGSSSGQVTTFSSCIRISLEGWTCPEQRVITTQTTSVPGASQPPHLFALIHRKHYVPSPDTATVLSKLMLSWPPHTQPPISATFLFLHLQHPVCWEGWFGELNHYKKIYSLFYCTVLSAGLAPWSSSPEGQMSASTKDHSWEERRGWRQQLTWINLASHWAVAPVQDRLECW